MFPDSVTFHTHVLNFISLSLTISMLLVSMCCTSFDHFIITYIIFQNTGEQYVDEETVMQISMICPQTQNASHLQQMKSISMTGSDRQASWAKQSFLPL